MANKFYIAEYQGGAVYEPAEGGYYVPVSECSAVTVKAYKEKHARRVFLQTVKEYSEYYGEPACLTRYYARWNTGNYVGDEFEVRITTTPEKHEVHYYGYC